MPHRSVTSLRTMMTTTIPPSRTRLVRSIFDWSPIEEVALAVSLASAHESHVYVERISDRYRWSLIHRGGPYPLLRITARFLQVDHRAVFIGFRDVGDGCVALSDNPMAEPVPDHSAVLLLSVEHTVESMASRLKSVLAG
jgi:hypothetical protein